jgi:hypothetical protein
MTGLSWAQTTIRTGHKSNDIERRHIKKYIYFDMSAQEREGGFELMTSALLGVVSAN